MNDPDYPLSRTADGLLATKMEHMAARHGLELLDAARFEAFAAGPGERAILFAEDPVRVPESWDALVVLPELLKSLPARIAAGLPDIAAARRFAPRYGIRVWPALLLLRDGGYVGAIEGMRNWEAYVREFSAMLARPAGRAPLAVRAEAAAGCH